MLKKSKLHNRKNVYSLKRNMAIVHFHAASDVQQKREIFISIIYANGNTNGRVWNTMILLLLHDAGEQRKSSNTV